MDKEIPEDAIGFDEKMVKDLFEKYGLKIAEPIHYGFWCGRDNFLSFQDIIVAEKT